MNRLTRLRLETFLICQRRFQLRYVTGLPWPSPPDEVDQVVWQQRGELFHQLAAQYYLGTPVALIDEELLPAEVRGWWHGFLRHPPPVPKGGLKLVETTLTVPFGQWQLLGRFDLLAKEDRGIHIFDWKTGAPRSREQLADDWQTRLYMALAWLGHGALGITELAAERLKMSYWYARQPGETVTFCFDQAWHERNVAEIGEIVDRLTARLVGKDDIWPLTDDLQACAVCAYRNYCGRYEAAALVNRQLRDGEPGPPAFDDPSQRPEVVWEEAFWEEAGAGLSDEDAIE